MEKEHVGASVARRRQLLEDEEQEEYEENNNTNEVDESAVMDAIEEADSTSDEMQHPTDFDATDHTDLYTAKRDRDRAWEKARKGVGIFGRKSRPSSENCHQASVGAEESDEWEQLRTRDVGADWTEPRVCEQALGGV